MIQAAETLRPQIGLVSACAACGVARSSVYAHRQPKMAAARRSTPTANARQSAEREPIWQTLTEPRFVDQTPCESVPQLLDEGHYRGSICTFYRVLAENQAVPERRGLVRRTRPAPVPRLTATKPLQVWTWDITQFGCLIRGVALYLYLILDLFSLYIVGWLLADRQSGALAEQLLRTTAERWHILSGQLSVHNDNGAPMIAKPVIDLWIQLNVTPSYSRPHVPGRRSSPTTTRFLSRCSRRFSTTRPFRDALPTRLKRHVGGGRWSAGITGAMRTPASG